MRSFNWRILVAMLAAFAMLVAACGGDDDDGAPTTAAPAETTAGTTETTAAPDDSMDMSDLGLPIIDPLDVDSSVSIGIAGSSTVFPLSVAVIAQWEDEGGPAYAIDSIGSGGGFERFCVEGASDISNASRAIKDSEVEACGEIGRTPIEVRVGSDALTAVVSAAAFLADYDGEPAARAEMARSLQSSACTLDRLMNDLLRVARLERDARGAPRFQLLRCLSQH